MLRELGISGRVTWRLLRQLVSAVAIPQLLFYLGLREGSLVTAVAAGSGWAALLQVHAVVRRRAADPLSLYGLACTAGQGVLALVAHSPAVYAGSGVAENLLAGLALLGSVAASRPVLPEAVESILRQHVQAMLTLPVRAALGRLTLWWALGSLARAAGLYVALVHLPLGPFLLVNTLAGWPLTGVGVLLSVVCGRPSVRHAPARQPALGAVLGSARSADAAPARSTISLAEAAAR